MKRQKSVTIEKKFKHEYSNDKNYHKVRDHLHDTGFSQGMELWLLYLIIKEQAKVFEEFNCLRENTRTCKTFSLPITKEVKRSYRNRE